MYFIIATGYNCASNVRKCFNSLLKLRGEYEWKAVFIDDGSTDETHKELLNLPNDNRVEVRYFKDNLGAAHRRYFAIRESQITEEDVIILLGMDDELMPDALIHIDRKYLTGAWMTYGNWITPKKQKLPKDFLEFSYEEHVERKYRSVRYRSTAPNTFKRFLFDQFTEDDFKLNGQWIKATTESNLMLSCLEMCGKNRIGVIKAYIYLYNRGRTDSAKKRFGSEYQEAIYKDVMSKPKRNLLIR